MLYCEALSDGILVLGLISIFLLYFLALVVLKKKVSEEDIQQYDDLYGTNSNKKGRVELSINLVKLLFKFHPTREHSRLLKLSQSIAKFSFFAGLTIIFFTVWLKTSC